MFNINQSIYISFMVNKLKKENELLKNIIVKTTDINKILSIDEYELFLSLFEKKTKKVYPDLPESDVE